MKWPVLLFLILCACSQREAYDLIITNVTLIDGTGEPAREGVDVFVLDGEIVAIRVTGAAVKAARLIDGAGKYLIPGLIDAHVHPLPIEDTFSQFIHFGVTSIFVPGCSECTNEKYEVMRGMADDSRQTAPRVFHTSQHFTMEGRHPVKTYPTPKWVDGETVHYVRDLGHIKELVAKVAGEPILGVKVTIEEGPTPPFVARMPTEFVAEIVNQAHTHDLKVFAHVSDNEELRIAAETGVDHLLHFVGVALDPARDQLMLNGFRDRGLCWVTTLMLDKSFFYPTNPDWLTPAEALGVYDHALINAWRTTTSAEAAAELQKRLYGKAFDMTDPTFEQVIAAQAEDLRLIHQTGIPMVMGSDVGSPLIFPGYSLHEELAIMQLAGFQPLEILKMATHNGAIMLGVLDQIGSVTVGKKADMILLTKNPLADIRNTQSIELVVQGDVIQKRVN